LITCCKTFADKEVVARIDNRDLYIICAVILILVSTAGGQTADPNYVEVFSSGFYYTNDAFIRVGDHVFFENIADCPATAGLYAVGIYNNQVLLQSFYHTYQLPGGSEGLALDIESLPVGTMVVIAAKDEPTRYFDERGQQALYQIGASVGLLNQDSSCTVIFHFSSATRSGANKLCRL